MTDASFRALGYALIIEEDHDKKLNSKKNVGSRSIRIKSVITSSTENVNLLQRISGNLPCFPRIQPCLVGNTPTNSRDDRH